MTDSLGRFWERDTVGSGFICGMGLNFVGAFVTAIVCGLLFGAGWIPFIGIGIVEWIWLSPLAIKANREGRKEFSKGLIILGAITFLLNAACWGIVLSSK